MYLPGEIRFKAVLVAPYSVNNVGAKSTAKTLVETIDCE
jgi:hypothetical protein